MSLLGAWAARAARQAGLRADAVAEDAAAVRTFAGGRATVHNGDCLEVLRGMADYSVDSCCCDPPYALVSAVKRFGKEGSALAQYGRDGAFARAAKGFMSCTWDNGEHVHLASFWAEVLRVLKPGGHLVAFGGTRTYHRMAVAIEDAGFEIRDQLGYCYGVGFPKSHNIHKNLVKENACCVCSGDALPSTHGNSESQTEHDMHAVRSTDVPTTEHDAERRGVVLQHSLPQSGVSSEEDQLQTEVWSGQSGLEGRHHVSSESRVPSGSGLRPVPGGADADGAERRLRDAPPAGDGTLGRAVSDSDGVRAPHQPQGSGRPSREPRAVAGQSQPQVHGAWHLCARCGKPLVPEGLGTALKPAWEPIVLARKPLSEATVAANVVRWGTGALNIDGCRVATSENLNGGAYSGSLRQRAEYSASDLAQGATPLSRLNRGSGEYVAPTGRWPANVVTDGSDEVVGAFPVTGAASARPRNNGDFKSVSKGAEKAHVTYGHADDGGSAVRFFYSAKASKGDRAGSRHPTVKPVALMRWLVRLVTPPGGLVCDPFAGSGTTGQAAIEEGFRVVLMEREKEYFADIAERFRRMGEP